MKFNAIKVMSCYLLLALTAGCESLIPGEEEQTRRAEQQREEQRQKALARIENFRNQCIEIGFVNETDISNCRLQLSIAYDGGEVLAMRHRWQVERFLKVAGDFEKAMEGFRQLCSDVGFKYASEAYGKCVLTLQEANRVNIASAVKLRNANMAIYSNAMWSTFLAYTIRADD